MLTKKKSYINWLPNKQMRKQQKDFKDHNKCLNNQTKEILQRPQ